MEKQQDDDEEEKNETNRSKSLNHQELNPKNRIRFNKAPSMFYDHTSAHRLRAAYFWCSSRKFISSKIIAHYFAPILFLCLERTAAAHKKR